MHVVGRYSREFEFIQSTPTQPLLKSNSLYSYDSELNKLLITHKTHNEHQINTLVLLVGTVRTDTGISYIYCSEIMIAISHREINHYHGQPPLTCIQSLM